MKKFILNIIILTLFISCGKENKLEYLSDSNIIIEDLIKDKRDFLKDLLSQKIEVLNKSEKIDFSSQYKDYYLLEDSYLNELNELYDNQNKFKNFQLNKINAKEINDYASSIHSKLNQSSFDIFLTEGIFDLIFSFLFELLLVIIMFIALVLVLTSGNIEKNMRFIPDTDGFGCFSIPTILIVGSIIFAIYVRPAERLGLVSSSEDKEIEKKINILIEKDIIHLNKIKDYNLKLVSE